MHKKSWKKTVANICLVAMSLSVGCQAKEASQPDQAQVNKAPVNEETVARGTPTVDETTAAGIDTGTVLADPAPVTTPRAGGETEKGMLGANAGGSGTAQGQYALGKGAGGYKGNRGRMAGPSPAKRPSQPGIHADGDRGGNSGSDDFTHYDVNKMTLTSEDALSTFAVDVDTASYSIVRRKIMEGQAVPADSVRVEEFVNYFKYGYEGPGDDKPFAVHMEAAPSPYTTGRHLVRVAVQGKQVSKSQRKKAHLVFLVDVSGSMSSPDRLPLAQRSLRILVDNLNEDDTVAMVTYAGSTRVVLEPTTMKDKAEIYAAIDSLSAGGSTAMGSGIDLAYDIAVKQVAPDAETRVIILSDGDANVGHTTHEQILKTIAGKVKEGVTLSTIGFGMGNYKDTMMEQLANKGNGNNYYIDGLSQAKRVFQEQLGGTLEVIAQDVKIQVDWNPKSVKAYRLVGYENRDVADDDFRNDKVDAGEIGAGHAVTAMFEVELAADAEPSLGTVRIRAKKPRGQEAAEYAYPFDLLALRPSFAAASEDFRFTTAVVGFAEILRKSPYADGWKIDTVLGIAIAATPKGSEEREEFVSLVGKFLKQS